MADETTLPPGDAVPSSTESDPNVAVSAAAPSSTVETVSAPTVSADAGVSQTAASSPAELTAAAPAIQQTFEQRVEARFLALEQHFMNLPHAIAQANGHPEPASWCERVIHFLFGKNEEPQA